VLLVEVAIARGTHLDGRIATELSARTRHERLMRFVAAVLLDALAAAPPTSAVAQGGPTGET